MANLVKSLSNTERKIVGTLYNGRVVTGYTTQNITVLNAHQGLQGIGHSRVAQPCPLAVPEPRTLGLLGTGLVAVAGMFRRRRSGVTVVKTGTAGQDAPT